MSGLCMTGLANSRNSDRSRSIGLLIEVSSAHARGLIRGISAFSQEHGPWRLHLIEQVRPADIRRWLDAQPCDGLIARVATPQIAEVLADRGLPVVNVTGTTTHAQWPRVDTDNEAVCSLAAGHLIDRGYRSFAFCGMPYYEWSRWRKDYFAAELARQGFCCEHLDLSSLTSEKVATDKERRTLCQWLARLPKPVGILACNDHCGRIVLEACDHSQFAVPDEIGVIGVDNDDVECELCCPPLSSIEPNQERIGFMAGETLAQLLCGVRSMSREILIKPTTLVGRRSTDAAAVRDPIVAEALRFLRAYACKDIHAPDIARHLNVSRRYLEQRFRKSVGRSLHTEIQRLRLEMAQRLLGETDWKLQMIAERSGFKQAAHLSALFYEKLGLRPGQYRQRVQNRFR
jgi:LacI family transcriptional regulator